MSENPKEEKIPNLNDLKSLKIVISMHIAIGTIIRRSPTSAEGAAVRRKRATNSTRIHFPKLSCLLRIRILAQNTTKLAAGSACSAIGTPLK
jgi:hypothetical protein